MPLGGSLAEVPMSVVVREFHSNGAHQRADIRDPAGGLAIALRAFYISVFRIVARDDNTLFGAAVVDFGHASCVIAIDDAL
jgi:hypothetical protein